MNNDEGLKMGSKDLFDQASGMRVEAARVDERAATGVMMMMVLGVCTLLGFASLQLMITVEEGAPLWQRVSATVVMAFTVAIGLTIIWFILDMLRAGRLRQKASKLHGAAQVVENAELELQAQKIAMQRAAASAEHQKAAAEQAKRVADAVQSTRDERRAEQGRPSVAEQKALDKADVEQAPGDASAHERKYGAGKATQGGQQARDDRNKPGGSSGRDKGR
jgi:uncharacterized membrane protein YcjF (UPF0283 family)